MVHHHRSHQIILNHFKLSHRTYRTYPYLVFHGERETRFARFQGNKDFSEMTSKLGRYIRTDDDDDKLYRPIRYRLVYSLCAYGNMTGIL